MYRATNILPIKVNRPIIKASVDNQNIDEQSIDFLSHLDQHDKKSLIKTGR